MRISDWSSDVCSSDRFRPRDPPFRRLNAAAVLATPTAAAQACRMGVRIELPDWNSLARLDDGALPLLGTALLIASDEYPALDADVSDTLYQGHAENGKAPCRERGLESG